MTELSVQQSKQGGNNAARFICKSARLAAHSGELYSVLKELQDAHKRAMTVGGYTGLINARIAADDLIKKIEAE